MRKRDARREEKGGWAKGRGRETEEDREGEKQEKQGRTSLFRGGCCGINSVKSRRADRERETERGCGASGGQPAAGGVCGASKKENQQESKRERKHREGNGGRGCGWETQGGAHGKRDLEYGAVKSATEIGDKG